jgi:hypothetical protein
MGTTTGVSFFYIVKLLTLLYIFYLPNVLAGDEPAPVIYMDPVTGELRVQNPPKFSRDHGIPAQSTVTMSQATEQIQAFEQDTSDNDESLVFSGIIAISIFVIATLFYVLRKKGTS